MLGAWRRCPLALGVAPFTYATGAVTLSGTSVALSAQPPDNCWQIQIYNPSTTVDGLIGVATAPAPLTAGSNASRIPAGTSRTFTIGTIQDRGAITSLVADSIGGAVTLELTYTNVIGSI